VGGSLAKTPNFRSQLIPSYAPNLRMLRQPAHHLSIKLYSLLIPMENMGFTKIFWKFHRSFMVIEAFFLLFAARSGRAYDTNPDAALRYPSVLSTNAGSIDLM
jgi:hypothetical protein